MTSLLCHCHPPCHSGPQVRGWEPGFVALIHPYSKTAYPQLRENRSNGKVFSALFREKHILKANKVFI